MFKSPARLVGFKKDGFHVSDAIIAGGLIVPAFLDATTPGSSAVNAILGTGAYAGQDFSQRAVNAVNSYCINTLGVEISGKSLPGAPNAGVGGKAVLAGVGIKFAGKIVVNKFLAGSAVKM
jgi:hypothetical protein